MTTFKMPPGGIKELLSTEEGKRQLEQYKKDHADDFLQPSDPRFKQVYGDKIRQNAQIAQTKVELAKMEWDIMHKLGLTPADFSEKKYPETLKKLEKFRKLKK